MRNKNKWSVLLLFCSFILVCSGCLPISKLADQGKNQTEETAAAELTDQSKESEESEEAEEAEEAEPVSALPEQEDTKPEAAEPEEEMEANSEDAYEKGILTETSFESKFIGLRYDVPEGVILATQEEAEAMLQSGADVVYADQDQKVVDYAMARMVCELLVISEDQKVNAAISVEKLPYKNMTEEQYYSALSAQLPALGESIGLEFTIEGEPETVEIGGVNFLSMSVITKAQDVTMTQKYAVKKQGDRIIILLLTSNGGTQEQIDTIMSGFSAY